MAQSSKIIKRRIKSITNTRKITKAMELVAASKMRRAVSSVLATRPYSQLAWDTINAVGRAVAGGATHPFLEANDQAAKTLVVVFSSDRGLAGPFNTNIVKALKNSLAAIDGEVEAVAVGRRGLAALKRQNIKVISSFEGLTNKPQFEDVLPISKQVQASFGDGEYREVKMLFTDFESALSQKPKLIELLPLGKEQAEGLGDTDERQDEIKITSAREYKFEPNPQQVLDRMLPRLVDTMVYQALLESAASEHSSRMMAMRNATDAAGEMLSELTFTYNQIRQAGITQEIAEISSGKAAIE